MLLVGYGTALLVVRAGLPLRTESGPDPKRPVDILKERYARGEIDDEEFQRNQRELEA